ncbi:hypothetical protein [Pseudoxanthomonas winnipegensis]|jgi:hypothetical protein|uniref:Lipoprotein n=1 Tax=Pseudoxanthomonas winnipegensis TaxID=2480810 RepID=A0A4Q8L6Z3_9GAMM|nr:hypothetical protein [Pseudoxanthomonas winnipegensis]PZP63112.1 MAG: hypothetical protein DI597_03465 [Pseudoxanthomonas spadix]TAA23735.1 hypothetical protein EA660_14000 [Pseudoxanthomonas winnipegensis]
MKTWILAACLPLLAACASADPGPSETTLLRPATPQGQACARQCDTLRAACTGAPIRSAPATLGSQPDPKPTAASCATTYRDCVLDCGGRLVGD